MGEWVGEFVSGWTTEDVHYHVSVDSSRLLRSEETRGARLPKAERPVTVGFEQQSSLESVKLMRMVYDVMVRQVKMLED